MHLGLHRVLVVGMSGSGKTTLARSLAERCGLPFHELDLIAWGPGWTQPPTYPATVDRLTAEPRWVVDSWGSPDVRDLLWARADTVVWLDYDRRVVLPRLVRRSVRRTVSRRPVFGGNRETLGGWFSREHPVWHAVRTTGERRRYLAERTRRETHLSVVRLRTPREAAAWLAALD